VSESRENDAYGIVLGVVVQRLRKRHGYTQVELAERAGITQSRLSRIERGSIVPDQYTMRRIGAAFDMSVQELSDKVERAYSATRDSTTGLVGDRPGEDWWKTALKVGGAVGLAGVAIFAISKLFDDDES